MEKEFVPYDLALELKELGFDEGCLTYYFIGGKMSNYFKKVHKNSRLIQTQPHQFHCTAPLYQQAFRWFREKYNLISSVTGIFKDETKTDFEYWYYILQESDEEIFYKTYEEAELACLKQLIKIIKEK